MNQPHPEAAIASVRTIYGSDLEEVAWVIPMEFGVRMYRESAIYKFVDVPWSAILYVGWHHE